jgi:inosine-uridine nucleoside N-ribohydrolase
MNNLSQNIIAVTDIGVDDALALVLLDKLAVGQQIIIVPTFGNTKADIVEKNAREFAAHMQREWYFHRGPVMPLNGRPTTFSAENYHGQDGLWGIRPPKSPEPCKTIDHMPNGQVVSLGPLTQAYDLLKAGRLEQITIMGGYFDHGVGLPVRSQANVHMDIDAAERFFEECSGAEVRLVPHDVTRTICWTKDNIMSIPEDTPTNIWIKRLMLSWFANCPYDRFALHDLIAVWLAFNPDTANWIKSGVRVLRGGASEGMTMLTSENPACYVASDIYESERLADHIFNALFTV